MLAKIEDFLEGGTRTNSQRAATWSSQTGSSGDSWPERSSSNNFRSHLAVGRYPALNI
jgi:hypothetical protein